MTDADCCTSCPDCDVHVRAKIMEPSGVAGPVGTSFDPPFPCPTTVGPVRTSHGEFALMPTDDHDTVMGFPRTTLFGWAMMIAIGCTGTGVAVVVGGAKSPLPAGGTEEGDA